MRSRCTNGSKAQKSVMCPLHTEPAKFQFLRVNALKLHPQLPDGGGRLSSYGFFSTFVFMSCFKSPYPDHAQKEVDVLTVPVYVAGGFWQSTPPAPCPSHNMPKHRILKGFKSPSKATHIDVQESKKKGHFIINFFLFLLVVDYKSLLPPSLLDSSFAK